MQTQGSTQEGSRARGFGGLEAVDRIVGWVSVVLAGLGGIWLAALAILICLDVTGRAFGNPVAGTVQLAATSVVAVTFLLIPYGLRRRSHVRSTIIRGRLPERAGRVVDAFTYALGTLVFGLLVYASWDLMVNAWITNEYEGEGALRVPTFPTRAMLTVSSAVTSLECMLAMVWSLLGRERVAS